MKFVPDWAAWIRQNLKGDSAIDLIEQHVIRVVALRDVVD
jgi:hypothetical protein